MIRQFLSKLSPETDDRIGIVAVPWVESHDLRGRENDGAAHELSGDLVEPVDVPRIGEPSRVRYGPEHLRPA